jgi:hypothetical protein
LGAFSILEPNMHNNPVPYQLTAFVTGAVYMTAGPTAAGWTFTGLMGLVLVATVAALRRGF